MIDCDDSDCATWSGCQGDDDDTTGDDDDTTGDDDDTTGDDDDSGAVDVDGDGWDSDEDCDDSDASLNLDDADSDGVTTCDDPMDCDDSDALVYPGAPELCDGVDNDCDPATDEVVDDDGDGISTCDGDCDDAEADTYPGAAELCDGVDNDCDSVVPADEADADGAGQAQCADDCDDTNADTYTGATEICDGLDNDCDGAVPGDEADGDGDGFMACEDCNDSDAGISPDAQELCDGVDNDCDGTADEDCVLCNLAVPTDHTQIQDAIDVASDGDVICVEPGTYVENVDFGGSEVDLVGIAGQYLTVIDGDAAGSVVWIHNGEGPDAVLRGFTLTNGLEFMGGGLNIDGSSPTVSGLIVTYNEVTGGGGLFLDSYSYATLTHVAVVGNTAAGDGGGIFLSTYAYPALDGVIVSSNDASGSGGGVRADTASAALTYCSVYNNTPDDFSGMADPSGNDGNVSYNPLFNDTSDPDPMQWDLHLATASQLVDAGNPGLLDPDGSVSDMGAYGGPGAASWDLDCDSHPEWWQPGLYDGGSYPGEGWDCDDGDENVYPSSGC